MDEDDLLPLNWRDILSAKDRAALGDAGFLHVPGVADAVAVQAMREAWTRALQEPSETRGNNDGPAGLEKEPAFQPCLRHPYVMSAVAQMLDGDVAFLGFRGRDPRKGSGQQGFHVDFARPVPADQQRIANVFWILDEMDESNGATRLIPGSHRLNALPSRDLSQREARHPEARHVVARAGDVLIFSAHLWHGGSKNVTGAPRRIAMAHFGRREVTTMAGRDGVYG